MDRDRNSHLRASTVGLLLIVLLSLCGNSCEGFKLTYFQSEEPSQNAKDSINILENWLSTLFKNQPEVLPGTQNQQQDESAPQRESNDDSPPEEAGVSAYWAATSRLAETGARIIERGFQKSRPTTNIVEATCFNKWFGESLSWLAQHQNRYRTPTSTAYSHPQNDGIEQGKPMRHARSLLRDISPPGMWPITSDDDDLEMSRRSLLSVGSPNAAHQQTSAPRSEAELVNDLGSISEDINRSGRGSPETFSVHGPHLLAQKWLRGVRFGPSQLVDAAKLRSLPEMESPSASGHHPRDFKPRRALLRDISPPGMWPVGSDSDDESNFQLFGSEVL